MKCKNCKHRIVKANTAGGLTIPERLVHENPTPKGHYADITCYCGCEKPEPPADNNDFKKPCPNCKGNGYEERELSGLGLRPLTCLTCHGQGFIKS